MCVTVRNVGDVKPVAHLEKLGRLPRFCDLMNTVKLPFKDISLRSLLLPCPPPLLIPSDLGWEPGRT